MDTLFITSILVLLAFAIGLIWFSLNRHLRITKGILDSSFETTKWALGQNGKCVAAASKVNAFMQATISKLENNPRQIPSEQIVDLLNTIIAMAVLEYENYERDDEENTGTAPAESPPPPSSDGDDECCGGSSK